MTNEEQKASLTSADKKSPEAPTVVITGDPAGGPFNIYGTGFGPTKGTLSIGGRDITITKWKENVVGGSLPPRVIGEVVLTSGSGVQRGVFPYVVPVGNK